MRRRISNKRYSYLHSGRIRFYHVYDKEDDEFVNGRKYIRARKNRSLYFPVDKSDGAIDLSLVHRGWKRKQLLYGRPYNDLYGRIRFIMI